MRTAALFKHMCERMKSQLAKIVKDNSFKSPYSQGIYLWFHISFLEQTVLLISNTTGFAVEN
jgi:hypothetical protein